MITNFLTVIYKVRGSNPSHQEKKKVKNYSFELDARLILFNCENKHVNLVKLKMKTKIDLSSIAQELKQKNAELGTKKTEP